MYKKRLDKDYRCKSLVPFSQILASSSIEITSEENCTKFFLKGSDYRKGNEVILAVLQ